MSASGVGGDPPQEAGPAPSREQTSASPPMNSQTRRRDPRLADALADLKKSLSKDQREKFSSCKIEDVEDAIASIERTLGAQRRLTNLARLSRFVGIIGDLATVAGDTVSTNGENGLLWAPIRHAIQQASRGGMGLNKGNYLEALVDILFQIGDVSPCLSEYDELFSQHPDVLYHVDSFKVTILKFNTGLMDVFNKPAWRAAFDSSWTRFSRLAAETKQTLQRNRKLLEEAKATASARDHRALAALFREQFGILSSKLDALPGQPPDSVKADIERQGREMRLQEILNKLAPAQFRDDQSNVERRMHESEKGDWLLRESRFMDWTNIDDDDGHQVLYLNGCPGAGKSVLVARVVQHLQSMTANNTGRRASLAYFYFKHESEDNGAFTDALRAIISQLSQDDDEGVVVDHVFRVLSRVYKPSNADLEELASWAIRSKRLCFLVLDGLDECTSEANAALENQSALLRWLKGLFEGSDESAFTVRILVSARREEMIEEELKSFPSVWTLKLEVSDRHQLAIRQYVDSEARSIKNLLKTDDEIPRAIVAKVMAKAAGMFLFAFIVLQCLRGCDCVEDLREELKDDVFPEELSQAYDRVAVKVFDKSSRGKRRSRAEKASKVLSWIACAARPLSWREIQTRYALDRDPGSSTGLRDRLLERSPKDICGCFVDVTSSGDESEGVVQIVHRTAVEYLEHWKRIPSAVTQHSEMLTFCSTYLSSSKFTALMSLEARKTNARTGYYAFQDYAVAHWWDHAVALRSGLQKHGPPEALDNALGALAGLLTAYSRNLDGGPLLSDQSPTISLLDELANLDPLASARNELFGFDNTVLHTREAIQSVRQDCLGSQDTDLEQAMMRFYGPARHKCPKTWCKHFHQGFEEESDLEKHLDAHDRPFRCPETDCFAASLGFESTAALTRHTRIYHERQSEASFPNIGPSHAPTGTMGALREAIESGSLERVRELITRSDVDVLLRTKWQGNISHCTPLIHAIRCGELEICEYLLQEGANIEASQGRQYYEGRVVISNHYEWITPLREAIASQSLDISRLILQLGGSNQLGPKQGRWPYHLRNKHRLSRFFPGYTTLGFALASSSKELVALLLSQAELSDEHRRHCLEAVCSSCAPHRGEILRLFLRHIPPPDLHSVGKGGRTLLSYAAESDNVEVVTIIMTNGASSINQPCDGGRTPLSYAARAGSVATLKSLLTAEGIDPTIPCRSGFSPVRYAAIYGHLHCLKVLYANNPTGIEQPDREERTPLFYAAQLSHPACVQWILDNRVCDVSRVDLDQRTALNYMAAGPEYLQTKENASDRMRIIELLINAAPSTCDSPDRHGWAPLQYLALPRTRLYSQCMDGCLDISVLINTNQVDVNRQTKKAQLGTVPGANALEISLGQAVISTNNPQERSHSRPINVPAATALLASRRLDFSSFGDEAATRILGKCISQSRLPPTERGMPVPSDLVPELLIEMFKQGFRPSPGRLLNGFLPGDLFSRGLPNASVDWPCWHAKLTAQLLAIMDTSLTPEYALQPECIKLLTLLRARVLGDQPASGTEPLHSLIEKHPPLVAALRAHALDLVPFLDAAIEKSARDSSVVASGTDSMGHERGPSIQPQPIPVGTADPDVLGDFDFDSFLHDGGNEEYFDLDSFPRWQ